LSGKNEREIRVVSSDNAASAGGQATSMQKIGRLVFKVLAWILLACIVAQVFIAGLAVFINPADWNWHKSFVNYFTLVPLVMFILSFVGKINGQKRWVCLTMFGLILLQYLTIHVFASVWIIAAFHPVIALLLFWGAVITVKRQANIMS
jgi:mercuric ion transport protein